MALDQSFIGRSYPPTPVYHVGREAIREFAEAVGDANPVYRDREVARSLGYGDVIAPPTFPIVISMQAAAQVIADPDLGLDYSRVVHGEQHFGYVRPIEADDELRVLVSVTDITTAAGNDLITTQGLICTPAGELIVTVRSTLVARPVESAS